MARGHKKAVSGSLAGKTVKVLRITDRGRVNRLVKWRNPRRISGAVPNEQIVKLKYCDQFSINPGALGTVATYSYKANSIFDPDTTGGGHQPNGHDQLALLYKRYVVTGSKITIQCKPTGNTNTLLTMGVLLDDAAGTSAGAAYSMMENRKTAYKVLADSQADGRLIKFKKRFNSKEFFGIKDIGDNMDNLGALFGANPEDLATFTVFAGAINGTTDLDPINCAVQITYYVKCVEPIELVSS